MKRPSPITLLVVVGVLIIFPLVRDTFTDLKRTCDLYSLQKKTLAMQQENSSLQSSSSDKIQLDDEAAVRKQLRLLLKRNGCRLIEEQRAEQGQRSRYKPSEQTMKYSFSGIYPNVARALLAISKFSSPLQFQDILMSTTSGSNVLNVSCTLQIIPKERTSS